MNPVVHFELPFEDRDRAAEFYTKAFGWKADKLGPEMGNYVVVQTTEAGENGRPKNPGAINGGLYKPSEDELSRRPSFVIAVTDMDSAVQKVKEAGGQIHGEPQDIPGVGLYCGFIDTEGNRLSLLVPKGM